MISVVYLETTTRTYGLYHLEFLSLLKDISGRKISVTSSSLNIQGNQKFILCLSIRLCDFTVISEYCFFVYSGAHGITKPVPLFVPFCSKIRIELAGLTKKYIELLHSK